MRFVAGRIRGSAKRDCLPVGSPPPLTRIRLTAAPVSTVVHEFHSVHEFDRLHHAEIRPPGTHDGGGRMVIGQD